MRINRASGLLPGSAAVVLAAGLGCDSTVTPLPPAVPAPLPAPTPPSAPTGSFEAQPSQISPGACAVLRWTTTDATTLMIDQGIGQVSARGVAVVCPAVTTTYTLTASGSGGTLDPPVTVTVVVGDPSQPPPSGGGGGQGEGGGEGGGQGGSGGGGGGQGGSGGEGGGQGGSGGEGGGQGEGEGGGGGGSVTEPRSHRPSGSLAAVPETIRRGASSALSWAITGAESASIAPGVGSVDLSGTRVVSPRVTTTYTLSASGPGGDLSPQPRVTVRVRAPPTGSLTASPREIVLGECSTLTWRTDGSTSQSIFPNVGSVPASGSREVCPAQATTYFLEVSGAGGALEPSPAVAILVQSPSGPAGTLRVIPGIIARGECAILTWSTAHTTGQSIDPGIGPVAAGGSRSVCPATDTTYTLSATGPDGSLDPRPTASVRVADPAPTGRLSAARTTIVRGECTAIHWTSTGTTSRTIEPGLGNVAAAGSHASICPSTTTTYLLIASGPGGALAPNPSVTITVTDPRPSGSLEADPPSIDAGACSNLIWRIDDASSVSIDQGIGSVSPGGSRSVCPGATTTYTLTASGPGGSLSRALQATVSVASEAAPTGTLAADPPTVLVGECSRLSWNTTGATSGSIDQGIGNVSASGSRPVCPAATTTYTLSASGPGGTLTPEPSATITVAQPPPVGNLDAHPAAITRGECSDLSWAISGATTRSIDQGIGSVAPNGSRAVCPTATTTYTLSASGPGGTLSPEPSATVAVSVPAPSGGISADPLEVESGECSRLSWNTVDATGVSIDHGIGNVAGTGSREVCPSATTTYSLTATGPGGSLAPPPTVTVAVRLRSALPTGTLTATVEHLRRRECTTLAWITANTTTQSIDPGIGVVEASGSRRVCPTETTTYTLTGSGNGAILDPEPTVTVSVREWRVPAGTLIANPPVIDRDQCSTLTWTTEEATQVWLTGIGSVAPEGSRDICPTKSVRYRLDAHGPGGNLNPPPTVAISFTPPEPVLCQAVSISGTTMSAGRHDICDAQIVDFRVETNKADSTIMDLYRGYPILDWNIQEVDNRYRHDVRVLWDPYDEQFARRASSTAMQPMIIQACPAGGAESVLACSGSECRVYPDEASVPAVTLPDLRLRFSAPWGYSDIRELAEGETLEIPLHYEVAREDLSADFQIRISFIAGSFGGPLTPTHSRKLHRTPERQTLQIRPGPPRTGRVDFQLSADRDALSQGDEILKVQYDISLVPGASVSGSSGCSTSPNQIQIRLIDP